MLFDKRLANLKGGIRTWSVPLSRHNQRCWFGSIEPSSYVRARARGRTQMPSSKLSVIELSGSEDIANHVVEDPGGCHARFWW